MKNTGELFEEIRALRHAVKAAQPLIHCITNPISINDCANVVLAVGGRPIMAEHPQEVQEITAQAQALALNLGNITDARRESILLAGQTAMEQQIPVILDLVGVGCSSFRRTILAQFLKQWVPEPGAVLILKGNLSELKVLTDTAAPVSGVDVSPKDAISQENEAAVVQFVQQLATRYQAVIVGSGKTDIISDGRTTCLVDNGAAMMQHITGTGCMLNALTGACLAGGEATTAAIAAAVMFGISGELAAQQAAGPASFGVALLDQLYNLSDEQLQAMMSIRWC